MVRTRIRIKEGVERGLCGTCEYSLIMKGDNDNDVCAVCTYGRDRLIPFIVNECNCYSAIGQMGMGQMERMAWVVTPPNERPGFKPEPLIKPPKKDEDE